MKHIMEIFCPSCGEKYTADLVNGWNHTLSGLRVCGEACYHAIDVAYTHSIKRKHNTYHPELDEIH